MVQAGCVEEEDRALCRKDPVDCLSRQYLVGATVSSPQEGRHVARPEPAGSAPLGRVNSCLSYHFNTAYRLPFTVCYRLPLVTVYRWLPFTVGFRLPSPTVTVYR